ncbi:hypothetical protein A2U01_0056753, partial [Trifolium medium]|nr:hypothetical protein [Trifolium medium]
QEPHHPDVAKDQIYFAAAIRQAILVIKAVLCPASVLRLANLPILTTLEGFTGEA